MNISVYNITGSLDDLTIPFTYADSVFETDVINLTRITTS